MKETVYVVEGLQTPLAGIPTIRKYIQHIVEQFSELFNRIGLIKGSYKIELEKEAKPYSIMAPRRIPIPLLPKIKCELEKMKRKGMISKINEPNDWCLRMVVPKVNNRVRICVDLTKLNHYVKRERHILLFVDHILAKIGDTKFF